MQLNAELNKNIETNFIYYLKKKSWIHIFGFISFLIFTVSIGIIIYAFVYEIIEGNASGSGAEGAWTTIDKFTDQSNVLLWIFMIFWLFFPKHSFMKGNKFLISTMVYIFFTFCGYNFILVPSGNPFIIKGDVYYNLQNMWLHVLSPLLFLGFGFSYMYYHKDQQPKSFWSTFLTGMIYPTIYCIYIITIPFVLVKHDGTPYSVYGQPTLTNGNPWSWMYIGLMYFVFFPGSFALFYYSWKWINKAKRRQK